MVYMGDSFIVKQNCYNISFVSYRFSANRRRPSGMSRYSLSMPDPMHDPLSANTPIRYAMPDPNPMPAQTDPPQKTAKPTIKTNAPQGLILI